MTWHSAPTALRAARRRIVRDGGPRHDVKEQDSGYLREPAATRTFATPFCMREDCRSGPLVRGALFAFGSSGYTYAVYAFAPTLRRPAICMFKMFARARRKRRAERYLQLHPEDVAAVGPILFALDRLEPKSARDVAEMRAGHRLSDAEWRKVSARWNRSWNAIR